MLGGVTVLQHHGWCTHVLSCTSTTEVYDVRNGPFQSVELDRRDEELADDPPQEARGDHGKLDHRRGAGDSAQLLTKRRGQ